MRHSWVPWILGGAGILVVAAAIIFLTPWRWTSGPSEVGSGWKRLSDDKDRFSVLLPAEPAESTETAHLPDRGIRVQVFHWSSALPSRGLDFHVRYFNSQTEVPSPERLPKAARIYAGTILLASGVVSEQPVQLNSGVGGCEFIWNTSERGRVICRVYFHDTHVFLLSASGGRLEDPREEVERFFDSFTVTLADGELYCGRTLAKEARAGVVFTPDGRTLVSKAPTSELGVWDVDAMVAGKKTTPRTFALEDHRGWHLMQFSPDGSRLAVGHEGRVRLLDATDFTTVLAELQGWVVAFSPNGDRVITSGESELRLYTIDGKEMARWARKSQVSCQSFAPDGRTFVIELHVGGVERSVEVVDAATGETRFSIAGAYHPAFSPDGKHLAVGIYLNSPDQVQGKVEIHDLETRRLVKTYEKWTGSLFSLHFSPDGRTLVGSGENARRDTLTLWDPATGARLGELKTPLKTWEENVVGGLAFTFSADGKLLVSMTRGWLNVWDLSLVREGHKRRQ